MRLLVFNLRTDADDHILGFSSRWLNALAPHYEHIDVLTTHAGRLALAENITVYSTGREKAYGKLRQLFNFYRILFSLLLKNRYAACFAHMQPLFASLAGIPLWLFRVKLTSWYTHRQLNQQVIWATRFSYRLVTAVPSSFPIKTPKLRAIGHGIDTDFYAPLAIEKAQAPRLIYVARLTEIKNQHILLQAARDLPVEIVLVGDIPDGFEDSYKQTLLALVEELDIKNKVIFAGAQSPEEVVTWYNSATIALNLAPEGLFDKAALEAMACAVPTIVSNPAFISLLGDYSFLNIPAPDDIPALRDAITTVLALNPEEREIMGQLLRKGVIAEHSLEALVKKLNSVMTTGEPE
jgi:glycosyltransferase involved in cell wall biosynthesis